MRIALLYPPPWKIAERDKAPYPPGEGPPRDYAEGDLDADFWQMPYGMMSLGAQALRAGHQLKMLNLSAYPWPETEEVIARLDAELFGLSCWTANRRGVAMAAEAIRRHHPNAHILVGGPHATPLAREMLEHYPAIDTVATGESEPAFIELVRRLEAGTSPAGIPGTFYRAAGRVEKGPPQPSIEDLDVLASPHAYFDTHIVMTSRGCPWQCTFCGAETTWGRGFRAQSVPYVLDALEQALARAPVRMVQVKDDTFTTNKKRVVELCRGIRERNLRFFWSCDTRVDVLSDELLYEMRLAGCQRLSLGVESGSREILKAINKKITVDKILESTELAKKYGIQVRFYMMLGNRGETAETFRETLDFLAAAKPHQYIFSCLSVYPGTADFHDAEKAGWLDREVYFTDDFQELKVPFDASPEDARLMSDWFAENSGLRDYYREGVEECRAILARLGDYHAAHMDLAGAYYREGRFEDSERHVEKALELGYPTPGLAHNYLACIASARHDMDAVQEQLRRALRLDPMHYTVARNAEALRVWLSEGGPVRGLPLELTARHDFQLFEKTRQPALPGPLPDSYAEWTDAVSAIGEQPLREADAVGSTATFKRRLSVV